VGGARGAKGRVGWDGMEGEGDGMGGWAIEKGAGRGAWSACSISPNTPALLRGVGLRFALAVDAPQFHQYLHKRSVREGHCIWLDLLVS
jgi:hypothetical protein